MISPCSLLSKPIACDRAIPIRWCLAQPALDIQAASPVPKTWVVTLANEYLCYVPTASAYFAGGYEVRTARSRFRR